jgi:hypothetical protein
MPPILYKAARAPRLDLLPSTDTEPVSLVTALIEALTNSERYRVVARDGELFIRPARSEFSRLAKKSRRPVARPACSFRSS